MSFSLLIPSPSNASSDAASEATPFWRAVELSGDGLGCLRGGAAERLTMVGCRDGCVPIPWQLDERDASGDLALDQGPEPNADDPPGVVDDNDVLLLMAGDAGRRATRRELPAEAACVMELRVGVGAFEGWAYALLLPDRTAVPTPYVQYDPGADVVEAPRFTVGFRGPTPQYFALRSGGTFGRNLLDRLKVRAFARFFGLIPLRRNEDDLQTQFVAWRAGPIRVVRRQRQWVRLGWGLRTPIFRNDAFVYRDFSELPVRLRLNFPPTYFFSAIQIDGILDFRGLDDWRLVAPGLAEPLRIGALADETKRELNALPGDWFALASDDAVLVQTLSVSPSLSTVARHLVYREDADGEGPESARGESPAVGVRLTRWRDVAGGEHSFTSTSFTLPAGYDVEGFLSLNRAPLTVEAQPLLAAAGGSD